MADGNREDDRGAASAAGRGGSTSGAPFRKSGSGASYTPDGNWAAERGGDSSAGQPDMAGAASGAGDGGFGPEGGFSGSGGQRSADVLGQVNGDDSALMKEAHDRGPRKADRRFTGGDGVDEPDGRD